MTDRCLNKLALAVHEWAKSKPEIERLWFFGSRVKGKHTPTSDLDIAIELTPEAIATDLHHNGRVVWLTFGEIWGGELDRLTDLDVDQHEYHAGAPYVVAGVAEASYLIFQRGGGMPC
jgi:hypothetical protein